jgi:hypothetical protein
MNIRAWCYIRACSHAYAERRFRARCVARAKQKLAHREACGTVGWVVPGVVEPLQGRHRFFCVAGFTEC